MTFKLFSTLVEGEGKGAPRPDLKKFNRDDQYEVQDEHVTNRTTPKNTPNLARVIKGDDRPATKSEVRLVFNSNDWVFTQATALASLPLNEDGFTIPPEASYLVNGNGNAFSNEIISKYYKSFIGAHNYVDHNQDPTHSHGVICDVVLRKMPVKDMPEEFCYYVDILVATSKRKDPKWASMVERGEVRYLSMGCVSSSIVCSRCGNVSRNEDEDCEHQTFELGLNYIDDYGKKTMVAGLVSDDPDEEGESYVEFIEESYLSVDPAFQGAIQGHVLELEPDTDVEVIVPRKMAEKEAFQVHAQYIKGL
jgi:hypothetical protein